MRTVFFIWLVLLTVACEKVTDIDNEVTYAPKTLVASFIAGGDSTIVVSVSKTTPVFGTEEATQPTPVVDASVVLSGPGVYIDLMYDPNDGAYHGQLTGMTFESGLTYRLTVTDHGQVITGTTTIPQAGSYLLQCTTDSVPDAMIGYVYHTRLTVTNTGSSPSYVMMYPVIVHQDSMRYAMLQQGGGRINTFGPGESRQLTFNGMFWSAFVPAVRNDVMIMTCDRNYALYQDFFDPLKIMSTLGPFNEPIFIYANMSNRQGIFGSYVPGEIRSFPIP